MGGNRPQTVQQIKRIQNMEATAIPEANFSSDGTQLVFVVHGRGHEVQCSITRVALEQHFWVPTGASDARLLKALADGRNRIAAVVERKMLKRSPQENWRDTGWTKAETGCRIMQSASF